VYPVLLKLGPLTIYSFGTMMAIAFLVGGYLTGKEMDRKGMPGELASTMLVWAAVGGLAGSRIWAWAEDPSVLRDPIHAIFSGAGFVFYGGLVGGTAAVSWVIRRNGLPWLATVDCIAPTLAIAHAIGRIGCQLAGDGDWGTESTLPWAMAYPNAIIGWDYPPGVRVHPTPIYEMIAYGAIFAILWSMRKRPHPDGTLFWWYLVLAPAARFAVEFVRHNRPSLFGLTQAQLFSLLLIAIGTWRLLAQSGEAPAAASGPVRARATRSANR
jgi:phosphatidylglycerol---prolipoprotein diacylglyceryl transferase